jgi:hypothetical protein
VRPHPSHVRPEFSRANPSNFLSPRAHAVDKLQQSTKADPDEEANAGAGSARITKTMPFNAADVCELIFNWEHPEKLLKSYSDGDKARATLRRVNDHHHIEWTRVGIIPGLKDRDFVVRQMWREVSQGNFIIYNK